jgi:hypothetical protein
LPNLAIKKSVMDDPTVLVTLLEIVGNSGVSALLIDFTNPSHVQLSAFADACLFAPSDDPLETAIQERAEINWSKQRFR